MFWVISSSAEMASVSSFQEELMLEWDLNGTSNRALPLVYLGFLSLWSLVGFSWASNTWRNHHFEMSKLHWVLASVPLIKAMQLISSFLFWYSCINLKICSLWMNFGAYVTGILFQTVSFVSFMLVSVGYCITYEHLSVSDKRRTALLAIVLYLTLVGYKIGLPYFTVVLLLIHFTLFCMILRCSSRNLLKLNEQISSIEEEELHPMLDVLQSKYTMFKKFRTAMQILAVTELAIHIRVADSTEDYYWFAILLREWALFCIFLFIRLTFRSRYLSSRFFIMPSLKSERDEHLPPIYSIVWPPFVTLFWEMEAMDFKNLTSQAWQVGVPTSLPNNCHRNSAESLIIIVQHPTALTRNADYGSTQKQT